MRLGGFFLWARLPDSCPVGSVALAVQCTAEAEASGGNYGVVFLAGPRCRPDTDDAIYGAPEDAAFAVDTGAAKADLAELDRWVRLCFAWLGDEQLQEGARRLGKICANATLGAAADKPSCLAHALK